MTNETLMFAYQQGDDHAFELLYRNCAPRVYGYLRKRISDRSKADELLQTIFLKLHQCRHKYDASLPFTPWLFAICRNVVIDAARTGAIFRECRFEEWDEKKSAECVDLSTHEKGEEAMSHLSQLPKEKRVLIQLRYFDELSFQEIARRLKISEQTARQRVSRAIRALRLNLGRS